ncbi:MAG: NAD(P)/FAD-dependent oxidoreductase, partial [Actinomycetes bacterium]
MTETLERPAGTTGPDSAQARAEAWLTAFEAALAERDAERAAGLFASESYWRDLVSFTWNITTVEHRAGVADLLSSTLEHTDPSGFRTTEPAGEDDGVVTAWFAFETSVGRGTGLLRLVVENGEDRAFTFLTTLDELKG